MTENTFFKLYLPAVEEAIKNDNQNSGYYVKLPIDYVDEKYLKEADLFIDSHYESHKIFFDLISIYFDAKSHYFTEVQGQSIDSYRNKLIEYIDTLKNQYQVE